MIWFLVMYASVGFLISLYYTIRDWQEFIQMNIPARFLAFVSVLLIAPATLIYAIIKRIIIEIKSFKETEA